MGIIIDMNLSFDNHFAIYLRTSVGQRNESFDRNLTFWERTSFDKLHPYPTLSCVYFCPNFTIIANTDNLMKISCLVAEIQSTPICRPGLSLIINNLLSRGKSHYHIPSQGCALHYPPDYLWRRWVANVHINNATTNSWMFVETHWSTSFVKQRSTAPDIFYVMD